MPVCTLSLNLFMQHHKNRPEKRHGDLRVVEVTQHIILSGQLSLENSFIFQIKGMDEDMH